MGVQERKQREKEQRRNAILDAAETVFFSKGVEQATMDQVAEQAELSKGTLYLYFKSKGELYLGITQRAMQKLADLFSDAVDSQHTGLAQVKAIGKAFYEYATRFQDYYQTIIQFEASSLHADEYGDVALACHETGRRVMEILEAAIDQGKQDGSIRPELHAMRTAFLLQGISTGFVQMIVREQEHFQAMHDFGASELLTDFFNLIETALQTSKGGNE